MNIIRNVLIGCMAASAIASQAIAQNLVQNPQFDADTAGWQTSIGSTWSNAHDHSDFQNGTGGSLQISTSTSDSATQCIPVNSNTKYVADVWIRKDPNPQFAQCSNPSYQVNYSFYSDGACQNFLSADLGLSFGEISTDWFDRPTTLTSPPTASTLQVAVAAICGASNGSLTLYVDDVSVLGDKIFADDFEAHTQ